MNNKDIGILEIGFVEEIDDPYSGDPYDDYDEMDTEDLKVLLEVYREQFKSGERYEQEEPDFVWMRGKKIDMNKKSCLKKIKDIIAMEESKS